MTDSTSLLAALIADIITGKLTATLNEPAIAQIDVLDQLLQSKFQQDSVAASALVTVKQGSRAALEQLIEQLQLAIQQDTQFAAQVQAIVQSIYPEKLQPTGGMTMTASDKSQAFQTKVGEGGTAYIGKNYIIQPQPQPQPSPVGIPENLPRSGIEPEKFVGRADELQWLHDRLQQENCIAISAIAGMGGVGKTELAHQYALSHQNAYVGGICWLEAREQNVGTQIVDFANIHLGLNPPETLKDLTAQIRWCWQHWNPGEVLVIFNDVADYAHIKPYIPPARFRVLMTTRLRLLKDSERLELNVLRTEPALSLLELLVGVERVQVEPAIAREICQRLGYLPLGLELVGRYLARKPDLSLAEMLERLQAEGLNHKSLRKPSLESETTAQLGVAAAFELSWNEQSPIAQTLGCLLSLFDVVPLPWDLIKQCLPELDLEDLEDARDDFLLTFHLLQYEGRGVYTLHELIREFFQSKLVELSPADNLRQAITLSIGAIANHNPLLVTELLGKKLLDWQWSTNVTQLPAFECGWHLWEAARSWAEGIGPLAEITLPHRDDGRLSTIGTDFKQMYADQPWGPITYVQIGYNFSTSIAAPVVALPPESESVWEEDAAARSSALSNLSDVGWKSFTLVPFQQKPSWPWQQTFAQIVKSLSNRLQEHRLPVEVGTLSLEAAWHAAWWLTEGNYPCFPPRTLFTPIPLEKIESKLARVTNSSFSLMMQHCINQLRKEVQQCHQKGETQLSLPAAVQAFKTTPVISPEILCAYTAEVHRGALIGYQQVVNAWFSGFLPNLQLASFLPARLVGWVVPPAFDAGSVSFASYWEPLRAGSQSDVDFRLSDRLPADNEPRLQAVLHQQQAFHSQRKMEHSGESRSESCLTQFWLGACPVTEIVYKWLWKDLKQIGLVDGELGHAGNPIWR